MIKITGLSIEKRVKDRNADGAIRSYQWVVVCDPDIATCDIEEEAESFIGGVRLWTAVHNNFRAKKAAQAELKIK